MIRRCDNKRPSPSQCEIQYNASSNSPSQTLSTLLTTRAVKTALHLLQYTFLFTELRPGTAQTVDADWVERSGIALGCTNSSTAERNLMRGGRGPKQVVQLVTVSVKTIWCCVVIEATVYRSCYASLSFHVCETQATSSTSKGRNFSVEMNQWLPRERGSTLRSQIGLRHRAGGVLRVV
jgi:hypothetical protein